MNKLADRDTPWGISQQRYEIAEGIERVSTASHGGYYLSPERSKEFKKVFPYFQTYTGHVLWFEEDCDAAIVILAFPTEFSDDALRCAIGSMECSAEWEREEKGGRRGWNSVLLWLEESDAGKLIRARAHRAEVAKAQQWERGSASTCDGGWTTTFTRVGDKARAYSRGEYATEQFYTTEELEKSFAVVVFGVSTKEVAVSELISPAAMALTKLPERDAFGREWGDSRSLEDCHSDADPGL